MVFLAGNDVYISQYRYNLFNIGCSADPDFSLTKVIVLRIFPVIKNLHNISVPK